MLVFRWIFLVLPFFAFAMESPRADWTYEWPQTDFSKSSVPFQDIISGGPGKDGIPPIDHPKFVILSKVVDIKPLEPVVSLQINGDVRAYPIRILMWHEIVNDIVGGQPLSVTYCPLCNTSIVFDRKLNGKVLDFGTTGKLRHSDLVMYDRQTESWWQQYSGEGIVGEMTDQQLTMLPSRLESFQSFKQRYRDRELAPKVLVPNNPHIRRYGVNPYEGYDTAPRPFLFRGSLPDNVPAMMRVVEADGMAVTLPLLMKKKTIQRKGMTFNWKSGQASALDTMMIAKGRDVGNVIVTKNGRDIPYVVTFAFAFYTFNPDGELIDSWED